MSPQSPSPEGLSLTGARWVRVEVAQERVQACRERTGLSELAARVLAIRWDGEGLPDQEWLQADLDHLHDPYRMLHMEAALDRLRHALARDERIRVVTDYDVDGTTSSLILQAALRVLKPDVRLDYHIPNRFDEGYGFSVRAAQRAAEEGVGLVVTADIGVRDHEAVAAAHEAGVDVLICDHHLPDGASVPEGATVLCPPQRGCTYPNRHLAACGVSLKLAQALLQAHPKQQGLVSSLLKLAAIGTVADMVPLTTLENRAIVALGLEQLNRGGHSPGLQALLRVSGTTEDIDASHLGFRLGPRINAAGRVADASLVVRLLNTRDPQEAARLAQQLEHLNDTRRALQERLSTEVLEGLAGDPPPMVVVAGPEEDGFHRGVVGIVASRIKEQLHRPAAVISIQGDLAVGSFRSLPGVHAVRALDAASDLLVRYGGHPMAAGFTLPTSKIDAFRDRLVAWVQTARYDADLVAVREIDAEVSPEALRPELYEELRQLGPFGQGNPAPRLAVLGVRPESVRIVGRRGTTLKLRLPRSGAAPVEAVWFGGAEHANTLARHRVDLFGAFETNTWNGRTTLQFRVEDARVG